ncbi:addiction module toxin RelE [Clostridia bacterium]|nr:addiction module toxin RelE [Clostridia bacterium]
MTWAVYYTEQAEIDLQGVYEYIAYTLLEPETAKQQARRIMGAADSLDHMPMRHRLHSSEPWHTRGLRVLPVDNFLVFYLPVEPQHTVAIIRIMYGGRDVDRQLNRVQE